MGRYKRKTFVGLGHFLVDKENSRGSLVEGGGFEEPLERFVPYLADCERCARSGGNLMQHPTNACPRAMQAWF